MEDNFNAIGDVFAAFLGLGGHHWGRSIILVNEKLYRWATTLN